MVAIHPQNVSLYMPVVRRCEGISSTFWLYSQCYFTIGLFWGNSTNSLKWGFSVH